jgi:hypothetical protein
MHAGKGAVNIWQYGNEIGGPIFNFIFKIQVLARTWIEFYRNSSSKSCNESRGYKVSARICSLHKKKASDYQMR